MSCFRPPPSIMEMGSISLTESGSSSPPNPSSSLNGLKFGRKIYFEDAAKPAAGSTSSSTPRKVRGGGSPNQGSQPPRCQVEGCNVDLSDAKTYYSRHKVCGMHSKSAHVIVGGIEQRFCQQCSRFHQLPEFDQGKRSCRRRLAGHNERRRKPPPGSLFSPRYGRLPSSIFERGTRSGGFIMDFTRDSWPPARSTEHDLRNQATGHVKFLMHHNLPWQGSSDNPPPPLHASSGTAFSSHGGIGSSPVECYTPGSVVAATDSSTCALSLLSNYHPQPWGSRPDAHEILPHVAASMNHHPFPGVPSWAFKGGDGSHEIVPPNLGQFSQPLNGHHHFSGEVDLLQQGRRQYMEEVHQSRPFGSSHQMDWPL